MHPSLKCSCAPRANARCPWWMGSKVPPSSPMFIGVQQPDAVLCSSPVYLLIHEIRNFGCQSDSQAELVVHSVNRCGSGCTHGQRPPVSNHLNSRNSRSSRFGTKVG